MLRRAFMADMSRRFTALRVAIRKLVEDEDAFGLKTTSTPGVSAAGVVTMNTRWKFASDAQKLAGYREWLKAQTDAGILEVDPTNANRPWAQQYIAASYMKGVTRAYTDTHKMGGSLDFVEGGQKAFLEMSFSGPVAQSKLEILGTRAFTNLQGMTADMDKEMSRTLAQGLAQGKGARAISRDLQKNLTTIQKRRANAIARTEIVHAHNEGMLDSFEAMNMEEVGVFAEWDTAGDGRVCPLCRPLDGVVLKIKEARGLLPRHPNCRCSWLPAGVGESGADETMGAYSGPEQGLAPPGTPPTGPKAGQVWSRDEGASRLRASIKAEHPKLGAADARKASRWAGAGVKVSGKLKPGSKAYMEAKAAEKAAKAAEQAKAAKAAERAAAKAAALKSMQIKVGMAKAKWGLADEDLAAGSHGDATITKAGAAKYAKAAGHDFTDADWAAMNTAVPAPGVPRVKAQMAVLDERIAKAAEAAKAKSAKLMDDAAAAVDGWAMKTPPGAALLDAGDVAHLGWSQPGPKTQSYGVLLFDAKGRVLLRKPTGGFDGVEWTFAKGGGKLPGTTALKELGEETGYTADIFDALPGDYKGTATKTNYFIGKATGYNPALMDAETDAIEWMTFEEAAEAIAKSPNPKARARDLAILKDAYAHLGKGGNDGWADFLWTGTAKLDAAAKAKAAKAAKAKAAKAAAKVKPGLGPLTWGPDDVFKNGKLKTGAVVEKLGELGVPAKQVAKHKAAIKAMSGSQQKAYLDEVAADFIKAKGTTKAPKAVTATTKAKAPKGAALGPMQAHADDGFYEPILKAAKTVSVHAKDGKFNTTTMAAYKDAVAKAEKALAKGGLDPDTADMLRHYVRAAAAIDEAAANGTPLPVGSISQFRYRPVMSKAVEPGDIGSVAGGFKPGAKFTDTGAKLGGSTGAKKVTVTEGGLKPKKSTWVMKDYGGRDLQAENEYLTNGIYNAVSPGSAPESRLGSIINRNGGTSTAVFNEFLDNGVEVGKLTGAAKTVAAKQARENFVLDAWLANWDAVGMSGDNMVVVGGRVVRIDNGGALLFRAQGGRKGAQFGANVGELKTLLDPKKNPSAAKLYKGVTDKEIANQITELETRVGGLGNLNKFLEDAGLGQISDAAEREAVRKALHGRFHELLKLRDTIEGASKIPMAQRAKRIAEVQVAKRNTATVRTKNDANGALHFAKKKANKENVRAVTRFTGSSYRTTNIAHLKAVRQGKRGTATVEKINQGLADLPGFEGITARGQGDGVTDRMWDNWTRGRWGQVWWTCPSSTSAKPGREFASGSRGVCYLIRTKGKRNAWVQGISQVSGEHEALFMGDSMGGAGGAGAARRKGAVGRVRKRRHQGRYDQCGQCAWPGCERSVEEEGSGVMSKSRSRTQNEQAMRADPRFTEIPIPCLHCQHIQTVGSQFDEEGWTCAAYPDQIPYGTLTLRAPHDELSGVETGVMVTYLPRIYEEDGTGRKWHYTADGGWVYVDTGTQE